jgi:hypothetical protein
MTRSGRKPWQFISIVAFAQDRVYSRTAIFVALLDQTNKDQKAVLTALLTRAATNKQIIPIMVSAQ